VRLKESKNYFAMKVLSKQEMIARNKVRVSVGLNQKKKPRMAPRVMTMPHAPSAPQTVQPHATHF
jgi:hypothetical protein